VVVRCVCTVTCNFALIKTHINNVRYTVQATVMVIVLVRVRVRLYSLLEYDFIMEISS
jgi:hypothetical protein